MTSRRYLAIVSLCVGGCVSGAAHLPAQDDMLATAREEYRLTHRTQIDSDAAACRSRGGEAEYRGMALAPLCTMHHSDAGRTCRSSSDCEGECIVDLERYGIDYTTIPKGTPVAGQCTAVSPHLGCYIPVREGRAMQALCAD